MVSGCVGHSEGYKRVDTMQLGVGEEALDWRKSRWRRRDRTTHRRPPPAAIELFGYHTKIADKAMHAPLRSAIYLFR